MSEMDDAEALAEHFRKMRGIVHGEQWARVTRRGWGDWAVTTRRYTEAGWCVDEWSYYRTAWRAWRAVRKAGMTHPGVKLG